MNDTSHTFRQATRADGPAVRELVFSVLREFGLEPDPDGTDADLVDLEASYRDAGGHFEVVEDEAGRIVGTWGLTPVVHMSTSSPSDAVGHAAGKGLELRKMYLRPEARGRGLGRECLERAIGWARAHAATHIELETHSVLRQAIALHEKNGFVRAGGPSSARCDGTMVLSLR